MLEALRHFKSNMEPSAKMHKMLLGCWLKSRQNVPDVRFPMCAPLRCAALAARSTAPLQERPFGQLCHTELMREKTRVLFGTQPEGFEPVSSCRCSSLALKLFHVPSI